ncbi:MAG: hypothetical protein IJ761_07230 [Bacteroidales bacterium]|nr:hypothetical protein [Bacteroidales bacterium]
MLSKSISIKTSTSATPIITQPQELHDLTQSELEQLWQNAGKALGISNLLANAVLQLQDNNHFIIEAQDTLFDHDFRPHRVQVLQHMRKESGMQLLDCSIKVRYVEKDIPIHTKEEKFAALVAINPAVIELRKLLPDIEI